MNQDQDRDRASILIEALPYIRKFQGATIVIKYGGHAMVNEALKKAFAEDVTLLKYVGINPVVVHGGGPQINDLLKRLKIESRFVEGQRFTDAATMDIVEMVLSGKVGKEIVSLIGAAGGLAVGLSGKDAHLIEAQRLQLTCTTKDIIHPSEILDMGLVGEPTHINTEFLKYLTASDVIPVIAPVGLGSQGETFNINADSVAGAVAEALNAEKLMLLTDIEGVLDQERRLIERISVSDIADLKRSGVISSGMIPKLECAAKAVTAGCRRAYIVDGRRPHAILLELFTDLGCGTEIST
ncbi:MAG: acetylglutamate kinase [Candidatus Adiutrix intracellularis]|jgi:acetylglutamate kinase|nr:MAG: acetylglutamate kinase [Candidatus Adiutrix intracellularis]MDR2826870.1 acetylglutamate kinase [Candidatus Adiutrix intracellularis]